MKMSLYPAGVALMALCPALAQAHIEGDATEQGDLRAELLRQQPGNQLATAGFQYFDNPQFSNNFNQIAPGAGDTVRLFERDGRSLTELESQLDMTRFGVMKHLKVLEEAGLVIARKEGREKLHFLNPVPLQEIYDRWISKFERSRLRAMRDLKRRLEGSRSA
mgnify:CR=1 FL=1